MERIVLTGRSILHKQWGNLYLLPDLNWELKTTSAIWWRTEPFELGFEFNWSLQLLLGGTRTKQIEFFLLLLLSFGSRLFSHHKVLRLSIRYPTSLLSRFLLHNVCICLLELLYLGLFLKLLLPELLLHELPFASYLFLLSRFFLLFLSDLLFFPSLLLFHLLLKDILKLLLLILLPRLLNLLECSDP